MRRVERATEVPMLVLALAYVPVFIIGYLRDVPPDIQEAARIVGACIIAAFAAELVARVAVARERFAYLKENWLDVLIVAVPFLRPLRILRVLRVLPFVVRGAKGIRTILGRYRGAYVLFVGILSVLMGAFLVFVFERGAGGTIQTFWAALWWAAETVTAVGYGDVVPITLGGRVVATILMVVGIILFGILTAGIAAYFVHNPRDGARRDDAAEILARFDALEARLGSLESKLQERSERADGGA
ncbi:MAG TPA: potassium channel family protein [Rubrobacteraceae bacterium]|nr:potassium channel family protein [Rubrobacteraceae bacterium]